MPTDRRVLLTVGQEFAGYRIEAFVARGGMAVVYRARDLALSRPVALKLIAPELAENANFRARFVRESEMAASIDHPNILPVYAAGEDEGILFIAMRFVDGEDLGALLRRRGRLVPDEALPLLTSVAGALDAAHQRGLVHRDVKPGNVLISGPDDPDADRHIYLTDFGLTKRSTSLTGLTTAGHFLGTIAYVAPEQIANKAVDHRVDVYALGCVLFEVLSGRPPFERNDDAALLWAHIAEPPPRLSEVLPGTPAAVDDVVAGALAKKPEERPGSCRQLLADLRQAFQQRGTARGAAPVPPATPLNDVPAAEAPTASGARAAPPGGADPVPLTGTPVPADAAATDAPSQDADSGEAAARSAGPDLAVTGGQSPPADVAAPSPASAPPTNAPAHVTSAERRGTGQWFRRRWPILVPFVVVLVALLVVGWVNLHRNQAAPWVTYQGGQQRAPFRVDHPSTWLEHPDRQGVMIAPRHLVALFTTGDPAAWQQAQGLAATNGADVEGVMLSTTLKTLPLNDADDVRSAVAAAPAFQRNQLSEPQRVSIGGVEGWRLAGTLSAPSGSGSLKVQYEYYVASVKDATAHVIFFSLPERWAKDRPTFDRVRESLRMPPL